MLTFSQPRDWEDDPAVKQVLVFPCVEMQVHFEREYNSPNRPQTTSGFPDENGIGAIYKLRAVKNGMGSWDSVLRCGFTGALLKECADVGADDDGWRAALHGAANLLRYTLEEDLQHFNAQVLNVPLNTKDEQRNG